MIILRKLYLVFLFWILIIPGICVFFFGTNIGAYLIFSGIKYYIPELTCDVVSGSWGNFDVTKLVYQFPLGLIKSDKCSISINLRRIWNKKEIYIDNLFFKDIVLFVGSYSSVNKKFNNKESKKRDILHSITFKKIVANNIKIVSDNVVFECDKLNTGLNLQNGLLTIFPTNLETINLMSSKIASLDIKDYTCFMRYINDQFNMKNMYRNLLKKPMKNLLDFCNFLNVDIRNVIGEAFYISNGNWKHFIADHFCLQASLYAPLVKLDLNVQSVHGDCSIKGYLILNEQYPINIVGNYIVNDRKNKFFPNIKIRNNLIITGELLNDIYLRWNFTNVASVMRIFLRVNIINSNVPILMSIVGRKIPILSFRKNRYFMEKINMSVKGTIHNYRVQMISEISDTNISLAHIVMNIQGNMDKCMISELKVKIFDGSCDIQGIINWNDSISWNNVFVFDKIDVFQRCLYFSTVKLSGFIATSGYIYNNTWNIRISELNICAKIGGKNIKCIGALYIDDEHWIIPTLSINFGSNIFIIRGNVKKEYDLEVDFKILDCNIIIPGLSGNINGICKLYGLRKFPNLLLKVTVRSLYWRNKNIQVDSAIINGNICNKNLNKNMIFLEINNIRYKEFFLRQLFIKGKGYLKSHSLDLIISDPIFSGKIKFYGDLDFIHRVWNAKINQTNIITSMGIWKLNEDVKITYQYLSKKIFISSHCWEINNCRFSIDNCLAMNILNNINTIFKNYIGDSLQIFPIKMINIDYIRMHCSSSDWNLNEPLFPKGSFSFLGKNLSIEYYNESNIVLTEMGKDIYIGISLLENNMSFKWIMDSNGIIQTDGILNIISLHKMPQIIGKVKINNFLLTPYIQSFFRFKEFVYGLLNVNIYLDGYIYAPKIYGSIQIKDCKFDKFESYLFMKSSWLLINFLGCYATLNGEIYTYHDSVLYLNGEIPSFIFNDRNVLLSLKIKGAQIYSCVDPIMNMKVSTDLVCTFTKEKMYLKGTIDIIWADIKIQDLSGNVVELSSDELILNDKLQPTMKSTSSDLINFVVVDITVNLGDDINFNGLGLHVKLKGSLNVIYNKNDFILTGHINIPSGNFKMWGQNLVVRQGQILFSGLMNKPYFDIEAIREIREKIIVGVRITGIFNQLKLNFFSNLPLLSQQEIITYLLGGKNLNFIDSNNTNVITNLLIGITSEHSERLIERVGKIFGFRDLTLNIQDFDSSVSLVSLSGNLSSKLQMKYGISIFGSDIKKVITVRYRLYPQFYVEAVSTGFDQTFDLLYQFNF